jgi:hypothetical protein
MSNQDTPRWIHPFCAGEDFREIHLNGERLLGAYPDVLPAKTTT